MQKRSDIFDYARDKFGTQPDYPWSQFPNYAVLRHKSGSKWYGLIMDVERAKLGLQGNGRVDVLEVKCPPELIGSLRMSKGYLPAYHMNKEHWLTIVLESDIPAHEIHSLIGQSFELTK